MSSPLSNDNQKTTGKKRPRNKQNKESRRNISRSRRPPPPPPPPASLVHLLQTEPAVLKYFQSLQANLEADVQVWKTRATALKEENEQLVLELEHQRLLFQTTTTTTGAAASGPKKKKKKQGNIPAETHARPRKGAKNRKNDASDKEYSTDDDDDDDRTSQKWPESSSVLPAENRRDETAARMMMRGSNNNDYSGGSDDDEAVVTTTAEVGVPIDDSMLFDTLNNDDTDDSSENEHDSRDDNGDNGAFDLGGAAAAPRKKLDSVLLLREEGCNHSSAAATTVPMEDAAEIFCFLQEAHEVFESLGIALVVTEATPTTNCDEEEAVETVTPATAAADKVGAVVVACAPTIGADGDDEGAFFTFGICSDDDDDDEKTPSSCVAVGAAPTTTTHPAEDVVAVQVLSARTDESVMIDIVDRIRNNTLIPRRRHESLLSGEDDEECELVSADHLSLCCNPLADITRTDPSDSVHPLLEGKRSLFRALVLIDTFCSPTVPQHEWDVYFQINTADVVDLKAMKLGLRGRKRLVDRLLHYLDEEVSERWACSDRSKRHSSTAVHYSRNDGCSTEAQAASCTALLGNVTSRSRLGALVERSIFSQFASGLHLLRNDVDKAARNILQYAFSTAPSLTLEDFPTLPPALSLVSLESLLLLSDPTLLTYHLDAVECGREGSSSWFSRHCSAWWSRDDDRLLFFQSLALAVHVSASIWQDRLATTDERIHDVACIELASYRRLLQSESTWLRSGDTALLSDAPGNDHSLQSTEVDWLDKTRFVVNELLDGDRWRPLEGDSTCQRDARRMALQIALILRGDANVLEGFVRETLQTVDASSWIDEKALELCDSLLVSSLVGRGVALRQLDALRHLHGASLGDGLMQISDFSGLYQLLVPISSMLSFVHRFWLLCSAIECAVVVADGNSALRVMQRLVEIQDGLKDERDLHDSVTKSFFGTIRMFSQVPVVRVINLERRKDRIMDFGSQALRERLLVVKAVTSFKEEDRTNDPDLQVGDGFEFGLHAIDGQGRLVEANDLLVKQVGSTELINKLVASQWRPNDLKPFDRNAPDVESLVRMSPSERACALSHVASWKGVLRSMRIPPASSWISPAMDIKPTLLRSPNHILRLFKISGFAEGPALLAKNDNMPPAPVCVILEDDAMLVDRFAERLADLLKELPRDFHFCSIGYSRPKSAPIVPFSSKLGIPSMLWYLTGYCLSEEGANHLLESLPVVGPVDSWIGLKMTKNWDNVFGMKLGVGVHAKPNSELPAHKDLCLILQFRAFCALQPLCTQKVRVAAAAGTVVAASTGRNWRQRDTDIEYSGDTAKIARARR